MSIGFIQTKPDGYDELHDKLIKALKERDAIDGRIQAIRDEIAKLHK